MKDISRRVACYLAEEQELDKERAEILRYGVETLTLAILGYIFIFILAFFLGVVKEAVVLCIVNIFIRSFSGGGHSSDWRRCLLTTTLVFPSFAWLSRYYPVVPQDMQLVWWGGLVLAVLMLLRYAPRDHPNHPINTFKHKRRLKILSIISVIIFAGGAYFLDSWIGSAVFYGIVWQILNITPWGLILLGFLDRGIQKIGLN